MPTSVEDGSSMAIDSIAADQPPHQSGSVAALAPVIISDVTDRDADADADADGDGDHPITDQVTRLDAKRAAPSIDAAERKAAESKQPFTPVPPAASSSRAGPTRPNHHHQGNTVPRLSLKRGDALPGQAKAGLTSTTDNTVPDGSLSTPWGPSVTGPGSSRRFDEEFKFSVPLVNAQQQPATARGKPSKTFLTAV